MFTAETIAAVQGERARAQSVIEACDAVLALCHPVATVPVVRQPRAVKPPAKTPAAAVPRCGCDGRTPVNTRSDEDVEDDARAIREESGEL